MQNNVVSIVSLAEHMQNNVVSIISLAEHTHNDVVSIVSVGLSYLLELRCEHKLCAKQCFACHKCFSVLCKLMRTGQCQCNPG